MKISVIGTGYVGLITGTCLAELGNEVMLVDIVRDKVDKINRGIPPVYEPGLDAMLKRNLASGRLRAMMHIEPAIAGSDVTFICVGTPSRKDGSIDLGFVGKASEDVGKALREKAGYHVVAIKSTVIPGTTEGMVTKALEKASGKKAGRDFGVASNPEFLKEGFAVRDFMEPDRIIIGSSDGRSGSFLERLYSGFKGPVVRTDPKTAEMIKYASNAFLATKISFSNELGNLCKKLGIDSYAVADGMGHDARICRKFLVSGIGYGGSCFPKDVKAIIGAFRKEGVKPRVIGAAEEVNAAQPLRIVELLARRIRDLRGKRIAVLGLAFKAGTDDIREAPSIRIVSELLRRKAAVRAYDPQAADNFRMMFPKVEYFLKARDALDGADACLILTDWEEFRELSDKDFGRMNNKVMIEGRRVLDPKKVTGFEGVCW